MPVFWNIRAPYASAGLMSTKNRPMRTLTTISELAPLCSCAGPIPECLEALTNLTVLGLSGNELTGKVPGPVFVAHFLFIRRRLGSM